MISLLLQPTSLLALAFHLWHLLTDTSICRGSRLIPFCGCDQKWDLEKVKVIYQYFLSVLGNCFCEDTPSFVCNSMRHPKLHIYILQKVLTCHSLSDSERHNLGFTLGWKRVSSTILACTLVNNLPKVSQIWLTFHKITIMKLFSNISP